MLCYCSYSAHVKWDSWLADYNNMNIKGAKFWRERAALVEEAMESTPVFGIMSPISVMEGLQHFSKTVCIFI